MLWVIWQPWLSSRVTYMWTEESSLAASRIRPDADTPTLVKLDRTRQDSTGWATSLLPASRQPLPRPDLELGEGGLYWASSWSPRTSHSRTWTQGHTKQQTCPWLVAPSCPRCRWRT